MAFNPKVCIILAHQMILYQAQQHMLLNSTNPGQFDTDAVTLNMSYDLESDNSRIVYTGGYRDEEEDTYWE